MILTRSQQDHSRLLIFVDSFVCHAVFLFSSQETYYYYYSRELRKGEEVLIDRGVATLCVCFGQTEHVLF